MTLSVINNESIAVLQMYDENVRGTSYGRWLSCNRISNVSRVSEGAITFNIYCQTLNFIMYYVSLFQRRQAVLWDLIYYPRQLQKGRRFSNPAANQSRLGHALVKYLATSSTQIRTDVKSFRMVVVRETKIILRHWKNVTRLVLQQVYVLLILVSFIQERLRTFWCGKCAIVYFLRITLNYRLAAKVCSIVL